MEIQLRAFGPGESLLGLCIRLWEYTQTFPLIVAPTLLWFKEGHSWNMVVIWLRSLLRLYTNTSGPNVYWRKWPNWRAHLELCHRNPDILKRVLNWIVLSNSTSGKCAPIQVIKQPEHGRTSEPRNNNEPPSGWTMINS